MIFVCLGTQVYQFDRLTKRLDELVADGTMTEDIFAQIGTATYFPQNYAYEQFISADKFSEYQDKANLIIAHGGTGALISASKKGKNIVAVPRLHKYGEHVDDHQLQIVNVLANEGYVRAVYDMKQLGSTICEALSNPITRRYKKESNIIPIIEKFINETK